ncbi:short-chain dehydrogenase/reductase SDR [Tribonema minus]|uniref:Short-chain dehydrogenase/reductase SDR n=1 Tax=Tribonema minus TaxID=303371 RepID=A0A835Z2Q8_9STRA|nr:short-chain dehydrogenase/reductase SDR [Tribonema minus]
MGRFTGTVAVVTGASSGIGLATAQQMAAEGAKVVMAARTKDRLDKAANGGDAIGVVMDASLDEDNKRLVDEALKAYGQINVSFINAGVHRGSVAAEVTGTMLDELYDTNVKGVAYALKHQLAAIERSGGNGSVVINSSCAGSNVTAFPAADHAHPRACARMQHRAQAIEAIDHGTRVNSVAPGVVRTNLVDRPADAYEALAASVHLMPRSGRPEEIARCVCFLASDDASFVTGAVLLADGGFSLKGP